jgi:hypothetical protein
MSQAVQPSPQISRTRKTARLLASAVFAAVVVLAVSTAVGGLDALAAAAVGLALVAAFLLSGRLPFLVEDQFGATFAFLLLGINYIFRILLLVVAFVALRDATWLDRRVLGAVVIGGALIWNAAVLRKHLSERPVAMPAPAVEGGR